MRAQASIATGKLGDHPHVDGDTIAAFHPERSEGVGESAHLTVQIPVGEVTRLAGFAHPVVGDLVSPLFQVPIQAVVREVETRRQ